MLNDFDIVKGNVSEIRSTRYSIQILSNRLNHDYVSKTTYEKSLPSRRATKPFVEKSTPSIASMSARENIHQSKALWCEYFDA